MSEKHTNQLQAVNTTKTTVAKNGKKSFLVTWADVFYYQCLTQSSFTKRAGRRPDTTGEEANRAAPLNSVVLAVI